MAQPSGLLTEEERQSVLKWEGDHQTLYIERGHLARFAEAIEDDNPLWTNLEVARASKYKGLIAPPTFLRAGRSTIPVIPELAHHNKVLDAGSEWEYELPVRVGDTIISDLCVKSVAQRNLAIGPAVFVVFESVYTNQNGQVAARQRSTLIYYKAAA